MLSKLYCYVLTPHPVFFLEDNASFHKYSVTLALQAHDNA